MFVKPANVTPVDGTTNKTLYYSLVTFRSGLLIRFDRNSKFDSKLLNQFDFGTRKSIETIENSAKSRKFGMKRSEEQPKTKE